MNIVGLTRPDEEKRKYKLWKAHWSLVVYKYIFYKIEHFTFLKCTMSALLMQLASVLLCSNCKESYKKCVLFRYIDNLSITMLNYYNDNVDLVGLTD